MNINILVEQRMTFNLNNKKINASSMAYKIVYGHYPINMRKGKIGNHKDWNGLLVDEHLDPNILNELNSIKGIEIRSVCEGHSKEDVLFVIFRPINQDLDYVKHITNNLKKCPNTLSGFDIGNNGQYRICCTSKLWYDENNKNWSNWWNNIPKCIKRSL